MFRWWYRWREDVKEVVDLGNGVEVFIGFSRPGDRRGPEGEVVFLRIELGVIHRLYIIA